jgi:hypothetical protein
VILIAPISKPRNSPDTPRCRLSRTVSRPARVSAPADLFAHCLGKWHNPLGGIAEMTVTVRSPATFGCTCVIRQEEEDYDFE